MFTWQSPKLYTLQVEPFFVQAFLTTGTAYPTKSLLDLVTAAIWGVLLTTSTAPPVICLGYIISGQALAVQMKPLATGTVSLRRTLDHIVICWILYILIDDMFFSKINSSKKQDRFNIKISIPSCDAIWQTQ